MAFGVPSIPVGTISKIVSCPPPGQVIYSEVTKRLECISPHRVEETMIVRPDPEEKPSIDNWIWIIGGALLFLLVAMPGGTGSGRRRR